jgi:hypothetical protein
MIICELFQQRYEMLLTETVFDVLDNVPPSNCQPRQLRVLCALVMYVTVNNQRPGIIQLKSFYLHDNDVFLDELSRLASNHPEDYETAREFVSRNGIEASKRYVRKFFTAKQNNADMVPRPRVQGPQLPQRSVGGDVGRMKIAGC